MDYFQTMGSRHYVKSSARYHLGAFTQYSGIRYARLASKGWQPKVFSTSSFFVAFGILKHVYIHISVVVNYLLILKLWQYNKSFKYDRFYTPRRFTLLCVKTSI